MMYRSQEVSQSTFNQLVLLSARACGAPNRFVTTPPKWQSAYDRVVDFAASVGFNPSWWSTSLIRDPITGEMEGAGSLLLQGEHDLLIGCIGNTSAVFLLSPDSSLKELKSDFAHLSSLWGVGEAFASALLSLT